jgi:hypothetical protein
MKYIITESQNKIFQRLRRLQELRDIIEYQTEIQDPCNFEDGEDYADFCISQGLCFFYNDEDCTGDDDDDFEDDEPKTDLAKYMDNDQPEREEVENLMYKEYYDDLVSMWEEDNEC